MSITHSKPAIDFARKIKGKPEVTPQDAEDLVIHLQAVDYVLRDLHPDLQKILDYAREESVWDQEEVDSWPDRILLVLQ